MGCEEFGEAVSARLDGETDAVETASVDAHLMVCARCRAVSARAAALNRLLAIHLPRPAPDIANTVLTMRAAGADVRCLPQRHGLYAVGVAGCGCPASCSCGCQEDRQCQCASHAA